MEESSFFVDLAVLGAVAWVALALIIGFIVAAVTRRFRIAAWIGYAFFVGCMTVTVGSEASNLGEDACFNGGDSTFYDAHWTWTPPGRVCEYPTGDAGPDVGRFVWLGAVAVFPVVMWKTSARRSTPVAA